MTEEDEDNDMILRIVLGTLAIIILSAIIAINKPDPSQEGPVSEKEVLYEL